MKILLHLTIALLLSHSALSFAANEDVLNDFEKIRKLSLILRGRGLTLSEVSLIRTTPPEKRDQLFKDLTAQYMNGEEFNMAFVSFLSDMMRVARPTWDASFRRGNATSLHLKFYDLIKNNRSWDDLLQSKDITLSLVDLNSGRGGPSFYAEALTPDQSAKLRSYLEDSFRFGLFSSWSGNEKIRFSEIQRRLETDSNSLAGVLTDPAFLNRHPTTPINQNRKRAAAVFRIFMCDEMKAVILPDANAERELELAALDDGAASRAQVTSTPDIVKMHANDQKCSTCHYKLDPMANAFKGISSRLSGRSVPGALVFKRKSGATVRVEFKNINELAQAITKQPEYVSCQVQHLWDYVIGKDVPMSAAVRTDLIEKFNESGRKARPLLTELTQRPEFSRIPRFSIDTIDFKQVSGILKNCKTCHDYKMLAPNVSSVPFSKWGIGDEHTGIVEEIVKTLDLLGNGSRATMPPMLAGWKLEAGERALLTAWIAGGAKNADDDGVSGKETFKNSSLRDQLRSKLVSEKAQFSLRPTFDYTAKRRMTPDQLGNTFAAMASEVGKAPTSSYEYSVRADLRVRNLESGETLAVAPAKFGSEIVTSVQYLADIIARKTILAKFGLMPLSFDSTKNPDSAFQGDMKAFLELHSMIYGYAPQPNSSDYIAAEKFIRAKLQELPDRYQYEERVRIYFQQLLLLNKFLTY